VRVRGRVAPLIALGAGFNPVLSGRENVFVNMSILGLTNEQIAVKYDSVLDFAGIADAIDAPLKTYSSGMAARLGFACAIHTDPDILLIDEVLAVGDIKFRMKCYRRLAQLRERGTSFILVSHSPQAMTSVCDSAIYLAKGELRAAGETSVILNRYEEDLFVGPAQSSAGRLWLPEKRAADSTGLDITHLCFRDERGELIDSPQSGQFVRFCIGYKARQAFDGVHAHVAITDFTAENERVLYLRTDTDNRPLNVPAGEAEVQLRLPYCGLRPGSYTMKVVVMQSALHYLDAVESFTFAVRSDVNMSQCLFYQPREWEVVAACVEV